RGHTDVHRTQVPFRGRLLPLRTPAWRSGRHRSIADGAAVALPHRNRRAAERAHRRAVELIVGVEIVDGNAERARRHERVEDLVLEEQGHAAATRLIAVVLPDDSLL